MTRRRDPISRNYKSGAKIFGSFIETGLKLATSSGRKRLFNIGCMFTFSLFVFTIIFISISCSDNRIKPSGSPSEILSKEVYNKIQKEYNNIGNFEQGTAIVNKDKYGLIDYKGKEILPCMYDSIYTLYRDNRFIVSNKKIGLVDNCGEIIIECFYDDCKTNYFNYIPLKLKNKWGFVDNKGNIKIQFKYESIRTLTDSVIVVKQNNQYGICDYNDKTIIPFEYDDIIYKPFDNISTFLKSNNKVGLANSTNRIVTKCIYDDWAIPANGFITLSKGKSTNYKTKRYGMINQDTGEEIIPFMYEDLGNYSEGLIMAELNGKYGYIDIHNKVSTQIRALF